MAGPHHPKKYPICVSRKDARTVQAHIRSELGKGNWGILDSRPRLTLTEFLKDDFQPFIQTELKTKPNTQEYYSYGAKALLRSGVAGLHLDRITAQHIAGYIAQHGHLQATTINRDLRTLRRALSLAVQWGKLDRMPKASLAKDERQRGRVLSEEEAGRYLAACLQPWRDVATMILHEGMRPSEVYGLEWQHVVLGQNSGLVRIVRGKSKAARRVLPMMPEVLASLNARHEEQGCPTEGWIFPTGSASEHIEESSAKGWHAKALAFLEESRKDNPDLEKIKSFEPYCLRHTIGTNMAPKCDVFALARAMGHSSIKITERYVYTPDDAVELAFQNWPAENWPPMVVTVKRWHPQATLMRRM